MKFSQLGETIFDCAIAAVRTYRINRAEPIDGVFSIPPELIGISHIIAVQYAEAGSANAAGSAKVYAVMHAVDGGLSVVDAALVRGIRPGGPRDAESLRALIGECSGGVYAPAVEHIRSELGEVKEIVALGDHFYRVEGMRAAELCYALFNERGEVCGLAFGPTVGHAERAYAERLVIGEAPLDVPFRVIWGGRSGVLNHHYVSREQRYALDLEPPIGCAARVRAIIGGIVIHVEDQHSDSGAAQLAPGTPRFGNHIVVRSGDVDVVYAHLRAGSVAVQRGVRLAAGAIVGVVGNSGLSFKPHLHLHAQSVAQRQGIPLGLACGAQIIEPQRGDVVHIEEPAALAVHA